MTLSAAPMVPPSSLQGRRKNASQLPARLETKNSDILSKQQQYQRQSLDSIAFDISPSNNSPTGSVMTASTAQMTDDASSCASSFCGSDAGESDVSVSKLKDWLNDFGRQHRTHYDKVNRIGKAPQGINLVKPTMSKIKAPKTVVKRKHLDYLMERGKGKPTMTPVRFVSNANSQNVQATNNGYASVKELSAWLADDPTTANQTKGCVRRGMNIIAKSRLFEKDLQHVVVDHYSLDEQDESNNTFSKGSVQDKRQWLQTTFTTNNNNNNNHGQEEEEEEQKQETPQEEHDDDDDNDDDDCASVFTEARSASVVSVAEKTKWLSGAFVKEEKQDQQVETAELHNGNNGNNNNDLPVDGDTDKGDEDKSTNISVSNKKKWLENAFKKGSERMLVESSGKQSAGNAAKKKWSSKRAQHSTNTKPATTQEQPRPQQEERPGPPAAQPRPQREPSQEREVQQQEEHQLTEKENVCKPQAEQKQNVNEVPSTQQEQQIPGRLRCLKSAHERTKPPTSSKALWQSRHETKREEGASAVKRHAEQKDDNVMANATNNDKASSTDALFDADSDASLGFLAARQLLVARSQANGCNITVRSKVQSRKEKFERWEKDIKKSSGPKGLLKTSWQTPDRTRGRPSMSSYEKTFISDVAPKRSFEDLP